jgi:signal transduction histidine kinase
MAYRSIRRVIGETSLERKCFFWFASCLCVVLFASFWFVESIAEKLVEKTAIRKGRDLVDSVLLRKHWNEWFSLEQRDPQNAQEIEVCPHCGRPYRTRDPQSTQETKEIEDLRELAAELHRDLGTQTYDWRFLAFKAEPARKVDAPADAAEEKILEELRAEFQEQMRRLSQSPDLSASDRAVVGNPPGLAATGSNASPQTNDVAPRPTDATSAPDFEPVYRFVRVPATAPATAEIYYYQPVLWKSSCTRCHGGFEGLDGVPRADAAILADRGNFPFRVVKVIIPDEETQNAIARNRAVLWATGILTVFMAMVVLYMIIRFVVIKPLKHLHDVSEEISRGNTGLRAEIFTNDEFEELASAFNRMLRHLTEAQAELRQVNTDLDAKVDQLAQLNMRLYEMNRLKSDFLANMSHELRTPLNSIIGFSEILGAIDTLTDKQKRYAQNIQKSGRLLLDLINDILDLAKIEAGKMDLRLTEFRIGALITAQCDMVRSLSEEKNIDLLCQVEPDLPPMFQDQNKIQQVLINLLSNAIKFTPEGGRITVAARQTDSHRLVLSVADTGIGVAEEDRDIIFEKFRQSSKTVGEGNLTREYSGTGLGLSIVKELCKLLGGEITFESELGKGSTFIVTLPWALPHPSLRHSVVDEQLDELVEAQRLAAQRPARPAAALAQ